MPITKDATFTARFTSEYMTTYTITYDANKGTGTVPTDSDKYSSGSEVTIKDENNLALEGYEFAGWNNKWDGTAGSAM